jgi:predicted TIM-barrel fold metal-dependent hydrolase
MPRIIIPNTFESINFMVKKQIMYYDIHCHIFNKAIVNRRFDIMLTPFFKLIDGFSNKMPEKTLAELIEKGDNFLDAFMRMNSEEVFAVLDQYYNNEFVLTPLMMDLEFTDSENLGKIEEFRQRIWREVALEFVSLVRKRLQELTVQYPKLSKKVVKITDDNHFLWKEVLKPDLEMFEKTNYKNQIDELETLALRCNRVKPFLGIDARRGKKQDLVKLIKEKILDEGALFAGVKLYAPTGFSPTDPVLFGSSGVYELCERHDIPITVHCSSEGFSTQANSVKVEGLVNLNNKLVQMDNEIVRFGIPFFSLRMRNAIKERALTLNHPKIWRKVFEKYPNLKLNMAHFGGKVELEKYVNYEIDLKKLSTNDFSSLLNLVDDHETRVLIEKCFLKKEIKLKGKTIRVIYNLDKEISDENRKKLWNALYHVGWQDSWSKAILDIVTLYPNAYTDVSCFSNGKITDGIYSIKEPLTNFKENVYDQLPDYVKDKILYGSDFFFILLFGPTMENYISDFKQVFGTEFDRIASRNPERFLNL